MTEIEPATIMYSVNRFCKACACTSVSFVCLFACLLVCLRVCHARLMREHDQ